MVSDTFFMTETWDQPDPETIERELHAWLDKFLEDDNGKQEHTPKDSSHNGRSRLHPKRR